MTDRNNNTPEKSLATITRAEAKERGLKRYFTGKSCSRDHVDERLVSNAACVACLHTDMTPDKRSRSYQRNRLSRLDGIKKWQELNPEKFKEIKKFATRKIKYGITRQQWNELFVAQGEKCAICGTREPRGRGYWTTDHCHKSNKVRGILCHCCNAGLGQFKDNADSLLSAARYLGKY